MQPSEYTPLSLATDTVLDALRRCNIPVHKATSEMVEKTGKDKVLDWFGTVGLSRIMHPDNPELPDYAKVILKHENPKIDKQNFHPLPIHHPEDDIQPALPADIDEKVMQKLNNAVSPYMDTWMQEARKQQSLYYRNIHKRLDYAREKCSGIDSELEELHDLNIGEESTPEIRKLESLRRPFLTITRSLPSLFTREEDYVAHIMPKVEEDFQKNLAMLAGQCRDKGLEAENLEVRCTADKKTGISLSVSEEGKIGFDAMLGITKGSSIQRIPHVRCYATTRKVAETEKVHADPQLNATGPKPLFDKLNDTLSLVSTELKESLTAAHTAYYAKLWEKLPFARQRHEEIEKEIVILNWARNPKARSLKKVLATFTNLVNSVAARFDSLDAYLAHQNKAWDEQMTKVVTNLTDKVMDKGMDPDTTQIKSLDIIHGIVAMTLCDRMGHELDTKLIVSGIDSVQRPPMLYAQLGVLRKLSQTLTDKAEDKPKLVSLQDIETVGQLSEADYKNLVTKPKILEYNGKMFVTCHIGGVRMAPVRIQPEEWKKYLSTPGNDKTALVAAHYPAQIQQALQYPDEKEHTDRSRGPRL